MVTHRGKTDAVVVDARWFRNTLDDQGKNQRSMAKALGCEPAAVNRILKGTRSLKAKEATAIAKYLGVDVEEVLRRAGVQKERKSALLYRDVEPEVIKDVPSVVVSVVKDVSVKEAKMLNIPVQLSGNGEAFVSLPVGLTKTDAEKIIALVSAFAKS